MTLNELVELLGLTVFVGADHLGRRVTGGYAGDLLSDVMAHCNAGDVWVTLQNHENAVAVAVLRGLAGIVVVGGRAPRDETVKRAEKEGVPLLGTKLRTFETVSAMIRAGVPLEKE